jgi:DNA-binding HxlR family transcriptional regulator
MALGKDYELQDCPVARALELVGERWTILVIRDCFLGVRRFSDFLVHLDIPRAVLTSRLDRLVSEGMLERREYSLGRSEYLLTDRGRSLWPILHSLAEWGDQQAAPRAGRRRLFAHAECGTDLDAAGVCPRCGVVPDAGDVEIRPGPGAELALRDDRVTRALFRPHRILQPLDLTTARSTTSSEVS